VPLRAAFGLIKTVPVNEAVSISEEIFKLFNSIDVGASLSRPFYELWNIAITMRANQTGILLEQAQQFLKQEDRLRRASRFRGFVRTTPGRNPTS
jgi:hypothetical protein